MLPCLTKLPIWLWSVQSLVLIFHLPSIIRVFCVLSILPLINCSLSQTVHNDSVLLLCFHMYSIWGIIQSSCNSLLSTQQVPDRYKTFSTSSIHITDRRLERHSYKNKGGGSHQLNVYSICLLKLEKCHHAKVPDRNSPLTRELLTSCPQRKHFYTKKEAIVVSIWIQFTLADSTTVAVCFVLFFSRV